MLARDTVAKNPRQKKFKFVFREELVLEMRVLAPRASVQKQFSRALTEGDTYPARRGNGLQAPQNKLLAACNNTMMQRV